jgi:hypothetical protein
MFIFEQGIGGVVQFPKGFLKKAYELVRMNGGVCIADEVFIYFCHAYCLYLKIISFIGLNKFSFQKNASAGSPSSLVSDSVQGGESLGCQLLVMCNCFGVSNPFCMHIHIIKEMKL